MRKSLLGCFLIVGLSVLFGCSATNKLLDRVSVFEVEVRLARVDSKTGTFAALPSPPAKRGASPLTSNGKIWLIGGLKTSSQYSDAVESFDPATGAWSTSTPWPRPRLVDFYDANGIVCAFGGSIDLSGTDRVDCFDTKTATWSSGPASPAGTGRQLVTVIDGKFWVTLADATLDSMYIFDPLAKTWGAPVPKGKGCRPASAEYLGGILYLSGCTNGDVRDFFVTFDPKKDDPTHPASAWTIVEDKNSFYGHFVLGTQIVGGVFHPTGAITIGLYDPATQKVKVGSAAPVLIWENVLWPSDDGDVFAYVTSARSDLKASPTAVNALFKYRVATDSWVRVGDDVVDHRNQTTYALTLGSQVYLFRVFTTAQLAIK